MTRLRRKSLHRQGSCECHTCHSNTAQGMVVRASHCRFVCAHLHVPSATLAQQDSRQAPNRATLVPPCPTGAMRDSPYAAILGIRQMNDAPQLQCKNAPHADMHTGCTHCCKHALPPPHLPGAVWWWPAKLSLALAVVAGLSDR